MRTKHRTRALIWCAVPVIALAFTAALAIHAHAASFGALLKGTLVLQTIPQYPGPSERVRVEANTVSIDMARATVRWYKNGALIKSGVGENALSITTGPVGSKTIIRAVAVGQGSETLEATKVLRPQNAYILWEAETFAPSWYRGKRFPAPGSIVKVAAFPKFILDGARVRTSRLFYTWTINDELKRMYSGKGKNTIRVRIPDSPTALTAIKLLIETSDKRAAYEKTLLLKAEQPTVSFYRLDPLQGILFERAIGQMSIRGGDEARIIAEPFFFSLENRGNLSFRWNIDGNAVNDEGDAPNILTLKTLSASSGTHIISVVIENIKNIFQAAQRTMRAAIE